MSDVSAEVVDYPTCIYDKFNLGFGDAFCCRLKYARLCCRAAEVSFF